MTDRVSEQSHPRPELGGAACIDAAQWKWQGGSKSRQRFDDERALADDQRDALGLARGHPRLGRLCGREHADGVLEACVTAVAIALGVASTARRPPPDPA
jgi:hypothetical protein